MRPVCVTLLLLLSVGCESESNGAYAAFQQRLEAGATCEELFTIRNEIDPKSPLPERMNRALREVGCYLSSSTRSDQKASGGGSTAATPSTAQAAGFTVQEYRIYRAVIDTPMSVPERQALESVAQDNGVSVDEVRKAVTGVQRALSRNNWFGTPESEIRHASDWKDDVR